MRTLLYVLLLGCLPLVTMAQQQSAYRSLRITKFDADVASTQQRAYWTSAQVGVLSTSLFVDTTEWTPLPIMLANPASDTLPPLALVNKTNLDTLSYTVTAQIGFAGAPDTNVAIPSIFYDAGGMPANSVSKARKTTVTTHVADIIPLRTGVIPAGATHIRFFISWQAAGQSTKSDGTDADQYEFYFVYPRELLESSLE